MIIGRHFLKDLKYLFSSSIKADRKKALYIGYMGFGNLGDEALKEAIFDLFKTSILFSESRGLLMRSFEQLGLLKFEFLFLGGGTLILRSEDVLKKISDKSIPKRIIFGTGVANDIFWKDVPGNYGNIKDWTDVLDRVLYLSVRGPISMQMLKAHNVRKEIQVIGDPVLYFTREISKPKSRSKRLGVNIGFGLSNNKKGFIWGRNEDAFFLDFLEFVRNMLSDGWQVEFIPVNKEDEALIDDLLVKNSLQKIVGVFRGYVSTQKTIDRMELFDVFVGQKLHATVLAYCANTPAVMVEYRPKCRDFMASIDMERFNVRTDQFNAEIGKKLVEEMYNDLESIRIKGNKICLDYRSKLIEAAQTVNKIIKA